MFYYISLVGYDTYSPVMVQSEKKYSQREFNSLVRKVALQVMREGWIPNDYDFASIIANVLSKDYRFSIIEVNAEYEHQEFIFLNWTGYYNFNRLEGSSRKITCPKWVPKDVREIVENNIVKKSQ